MSPLAVMQQTRSQYKISMTELAAVSGLPVSYLERIEEGQIQPLEHDLKRILKALKTLSEDPERPGKEASHG